MDTCAVVITSAEPIREEEDSYIGINSVTQKEERRYQRIGEPEQKGE